MKNITIVVFVILSIFGCNTKKNITKQGDLSENVQGFAQRLRSDSIYHISYVYANSKNETASRYKTEIKLSTEIVYKVYNQLKDILKPNDLWDPEYKLAVTDSLDYLVKIALAENMNDYLLISFSETKLKEDTYETHMVGELHYLSIADSFKELANSGKKLPKGFTACRLMELAEFYETKVTRYFENRLNNSGIVKSPLFYGINSVLNLNYDYALQVQYREQGLEDWKYPYYEEYEPYSYTQTAWDTLYIFSYPEMKLKRKVGLNIPMKKIQELKAVENDNNKLLFIQFQEGFELHKLLNNKDTLLTSHQSADLSTISPDGKKITYVEYKEFSVPEDSYYANCMVDYYIDNETLIPYNRLSSSPYDDSYYEENVSQMQKVDDNDKYTYLSYNKDNQLVYKKHKGKKIALTVDFIPPPYPIYYYESSSNVPSKIIDTQFFPESNFLYILSYVDDFELDYKGYMISLLNIESGEYYAHVKTGPYDTKNIIEFNPETSAPSEIKDKLTFKLDKDYKQDSIDLHSYFPESNDFFIREYVYDIKDSTLVFSDDRGLIKMNTKTKEYFQFGFSPLLIWINNFGSTNSLFDYKSVYFTDDNKILTIQENNTILLWDIKIKE